MVVEQINVLVDSSTEPVDEVAGVRLQQSKHDFVYLLVENDYLGYLNFDILKLLYVRDRERVDSRRHGILGVHDCAADLSVFLLLVLVNLLDHLLELQHQVCVLLQQVFLQLDLVLKL